MEATQPSLKELLQHPGFAATLLVPSNAAFDAALAKYGAPGWGKRGDTWQRWVVAAKAVGGCSLGVLLPRVLRTSRATHSLNRLPCPVPALCRLCPPAGALLQSPALLQQLIKFHVVPPEPVRRTQGQHGGFGGGYGTVWGAGRRVQGWPLSPHLSRLLLPAGAARAVDLTPAVHRAQALHTLRRPRHAQRCGRGLHGCSQREAVGSGEAVCSQQPQLSPASAQIQAGLMVHPPAALPCSAPL